ncbi:hypothetical protein PG993_006945 [Apiospora rasikravindrae]|uniref:Cell wall protein n=1 Tax=Apiospora rasikravindrae TaxID=990691 RepID=A0ABR1SW29_9PEZI
MKYSSILPVTLLAGLGAARSSIDKRTASTTLPGAMSDVVSAARTLDHVVGGYGGGEAEDVECAINTAVVVLRHATALCHGLPSGPLSAEDAAAFQASSASLGRAGRGLVSSFADKIPAFNEARICNSVTTHVTDLDDGVAALYKASAVANTTKPFGELKDSMGECNACGVLDDALNDAPYSGVPIGLPGPNGTTGAGNYYPGPVGTNGAAAAGVSCGAVFVAAVAAFFF